MPLSWLWGYIQSNDCTFDKEDRDAKMKEQK
jgi:hypothetical protein